MPNQNKNSTPLDPIIDLFIFMIELLIDVFLNLISWSLKKILNRKKKVVGVIRKVNLKVKKNTTNPKMLGVSCLNKKEIELKSLKTHMHTLLIGASGFGKSNTLNLLLENSLQKEMPIIYLDPKGSKAAIREFKSLCEFYKKDCYIFSDHEETGFVFNTFDGLKPDEIVISIMRSLEWSEPYYKARSQQALFKAIKYLKEENKVITLISIYEYLEKEEAKNNDIAGLMSQLQMIKESSFCKLLDIKEEHLISKKVITTRDIKKYKRCLYVGLSTQAKGDIARVFGKIFLNSMMMLSHYAGVENEYQEEAINNGLSFILDEAGSMVFPDFIDLLNKCRSSGINIYACIQSIADFEVLGSEFMRQCLENFNTWLISKQADTKSAEYLASSIGTIHTEKITSSTEDGDKTSRGSVRETNEYRCHPDILREIGVGQMVLVSRSPYIVDLLNIRFVGNSEAFNFSRKEQILRDTRVNRRDQDVSPI